MKRMIAITFVILLLLTSCGERLSDCPAAADYSTTDIADCLEYWRATDNYQEQKNLYDTKTVEFPVPQPTSEDFRLRYAEIYNSYIYFLFQYREASDKKILAEYSMWVVIAVDGTTFDEVTKEHGLETGKTYAYQTDGNAYTWYFRGSDGRCITVTFPVGHVVDTPEKVRDYITFVGIEEFLAK